MNKNNTASNSLASNTAKQIQKAKQNQYNELGKPTLVDSIISKVKENSDNTLRIYIICVIPILFLLAYVVYKYNFSTRSEHSILKMGYKTQITLPPLPQCYSLDVSEQYKLCDYYISSSFMTPCVGNQHYDYVSNDMISEVIKSGARYIQIPICESDVSLQALPVVATAVYGQKVITSLNTLEMRSVLKIIRTSAFKINNKTINYPLIIHLVLNTSNRFTLNKLAENIEEIIGDVLLDTTKYKTFPIYLEKLCNIQSKIILFATPSYMGSDLEKYIVPTTNLFELYHFSELGPLNMPNKTVYKNPYNQRLSSIEQYRSNESFKTKYPSLDYIVKNADSIGDTIKNDNEILNNLTCFNKVGMTVVKPVYPDDVISKNYDTAESIYYGCQFTTMNFQVNDINMQNYLTIFSESSFRLKPASLRFSEVEEPIEDLLKIYQPVTPKDDKIINDFYFKYNNLLIAFESYTLQNTYLTQIETNLRFRLGANQIADKSGNDIYKINITQCFIPRKSNISTAGNISVYLESASKQGFFITMNSTLFDLENLSTNKKNLLNQALYIEKPKSTDKEIDSMMLSIKTTDDKKPMYLAYENKIVKAYADAPQAEAQNNMTFILHIIPFKYIIKIVTMFEGSLKTMGGNIIGLLENNIEGGTAFYVIPIKKSNTTNFNMFKDQFMLQNKNKKTFVQYDLDTSYLYDNAIQPNPNSTFNLVPFNGYYTILNTNNDTLAVKDKNLIKFVNPEDISSNENLFMIDIVYELI
jgi:hypothetical protein